MDPITVTLFTLLITGTVALVTLLIKSFFKNVKQSDCCLGGHIEMKSNTSQPSQTNLNASN